MQIVWLSIFSRNTHGIRASCRTAFLTAFQMSLVHCVRTTFIRTRQRLFNATRDLRQIAEVRCKFARSFDNGLERVYIKDSWARTSPYATRPLYSHCHKFRDFLTSVEARKICYTFKRENWLKVSPLYSVALFFVKGYNINVSPTLVFWRQRVHPQEIPALSFLRHMMAVAPWCPVLSNTNGDMWCIDISSLHPHHQEHVRFLDNTTQ